MPEHSSNSDQVRQAEDAVIGPLIVRLAHERHITLLTLQQRADLSPEYAAGMRDGNREISSWAIVRCARVLALPHAPAEGIQEPELSTVVAQIRQHLLKIADSI